MHAARAIRRCLPDRRVTGDCFAVGSASRHRLRSTQLWRPRTGSGFLENENVRVLEYVLEPGERDQWHTHPAKVSYVRGGELRIHLADGVVPQRGKGRRGRMDGCGATPLCRECGDYAGPHRSDRSEVRRRRLEFRGSAHESGAANRLRAALRGRMEQPESRAAGFVLCGERVAHGQCRHRRRWGARRSPRPRNRI